MSRFTYHAPNLCLCRKKHLPEKFPEAPQSPAGLGKPMRHLRDALDELHEAESDEDRARAERKVRLAETELGPEAPALRAAYETYKEMLAAYRSDICGACGSSLLCPVLRAGCAFCLPDGLVNIEPKETP